MIDNKSNDNLVSVVMPHCDDTRFLRDALDSVYTQTYQHFEIILIDSSDDKSFADSIISAYDKRLKLFFQPKNGVASALNYGISKAGGEYIARLDSDDRALPLRFERQVNAFQSNPGVGLVCSGMEIIDENGKIKRSNNVVLSDYELKIELLFSNPIMHPSVMIRRELFDRGFLYKEGIVAEDYELWTRLALETSFLMSPEVLSQYRVHDNNATTRYVDQARLAVSDALKEYIRKLFNLDCHLYEETDFLFLGFIPNIEEVSIDYILRQFKLLYSIDKANTIKKRFPYSLLNKRIFSRIDSILYKRFKSAYELCHYGISGYMKDEHAEPSEHLFDRLLEGYGFRDNDVSGMLKMIEGDLIELDRNDYSIELLQYPSSCLIYGVGKVGSLISESLCGRIKSGSIKWIIAGYLDKTKEEIIINGKSQPVISPIDADYNSVDYVIVCSFLYYEEMYEELLAAGCPAEKIIRCDWLL